MLSFHGLKGCAVSSYKIDRLESSQILLQNKFCFFFLNIIYSFSIHLHYYFKLWDKSKYLPCCRAHRNHLHVFYYNSALRYSRIGIPLKVSIILKRLPPWLSSKESACNARVIGDASSIPGLVRSPGEGHDNTLQYSCL